ncbi:fumarylacetoacetate hydrolase family protein [Aeromicrobium sp. P5_D10]
MSTLTTPDPTTWPPTAASLLPDDHEQATLVGRIFVPAVGGPCVVTLRGQDLVDVTARFATMRDLAEEPDPAAAVRSVDGPIVARLEDVVAATPSELRRPDAPWLLSPIDLQSVKAAGVTFAVSMLERVIEERSGGDVAQAGRLRDDISSRIAGDLTSVRPGSPEAARLKAMLVAEGAWSQYLEVGLGPDAEIFTKTSPMATVGAGADVGVRADSSWNNPEPEVVLLVSSTARIVGAMLGNDVNLRDFEGRSALLLTKAKDNTASAALGPFIRLFDEGFGLDDVRAATVTLEVAGTDGFRLEGMSSMSLISRDPTELVDQLMGATHQYPDGAVLFLGTMFAPVEDRDEPGKGFTHRFDDVVSIREPRLGALVNRVRTSEVCEPWTFGTAALFRNLAQRGLL